MVNRTLYWVKIDHLDSVVRIVWYALLCHTHIRWLQWWSQVYARATWCEWYRWHCQKQLDPVKCCLRRVVCLSNSHPMQNDSSNPFIANYQIYRLPLKTIKILSWHLRLVLNWTLESPSLPFHAHRHLCKSIWGKDEKTIFGPKDCLSAISGSSFDRKLLLFGLLSARERDREWEG